MDWTGVRSVRRLLVADPKFGKGAECNVSAPSSYIANAYNELYAFYTGKCGFLKTKF